MSDTESVEQRLSRLEAHVRRLEDQIAIYQLLATYSPAVDSRSEAATAGLWTEDGQYDYGGRPHVGARDVGSLVHLDTHKAYVEKGCAHVMSLPLVSVDGDRAVATGYSRLYVHSGDGWKVERASANRWELVRTGAGWRVANRINRLMDGSPAGREVLARGLDTGESGEIGK